MIDHGFIRVLLDECRNNQNKLLHLNGLELTELPEEISEFTWLNGLSCNNNLISDIGLLSNMTNLISLSFNGNLVTDLSPLFKLTRLKMLWFGNNKVVDISPIKELNKLCGLFCFNNQIVDIEPMISLPMLEQLTIHSNPISNLNLLDKLTPQLNQLCVRKGQILFPSKHKHITFGDAR